MTMTQETKTRIPQWSFADRIRKARSESGLDQRAFATRIQVKPSTYATYETGRNEPRFKDVFNLARRVEEETGVSAAWLIGQPSDYMSTVVVPIRAIRDRPMGRRDSTGPSRKAA